MDSWRDMDKKRTVLSDLEFKSCSQIVITGGLIRGISSSIPRTVPSYAHNLLSPCSVTQFLFPLRKSFLWLSPHSLIALWLPLHGSLDWWTAISPTGEPSGKKGHMAPDSQICLRHVMHRGGKLGHNTETTHTTHGGSAAALLVAVKPWDKNCRPRNWWTQRGLIPSWTSLETHH